MKNKVFRLRALILTVALLLLIGGCGSTTVPMQEKQKKNSPQKEENASQSAGTAHDSTGKSAASKKKAASAPASGEEIGKRKAAASLGNSSESSTKKKGQNKSSAEKDGASQLPSRDLRIKLGFAGDLNLSEGWETTVRMDGRKRGIEDCFSKKTLKRMRGFDLFMLNNEFTFSRRGSPSGKTFTFRADPDRVAELKKLGVDIVLLANNHVNDFGEKALLDTLKTLDNAQIRHVGAGKNLEEASSPVYFDLYGRKIAYVAASCAEEHEDTIWTKPATKKKPGIFGCYDPSAFYKAVREADRNADFVIASVHWGYEYLDYYTEEQKEMAQNLVEAGADAVIGTHPHVLQGVEMMGDTPVFYSLGNFWFNGEELMTGMAELTLLMPADPDEPLRLERVRFIPCMQKETYTAEAEDELTREQILQHMREISFGTDIDPEGKISR